MAAVGDRIPEVNVWHMTSDGPATVSSLDVLGKGKVVLFAVPGAFTPTCSDHHLPGFLIRVDELASKGVGTVACIAVNDTYVMDAWGRSQHVGDDVVMLADGSGEFAKAMGLELDLTGGGLGVRSKRYAAVIEDGVITYLGVEPGPGLSVSSAESVLAEL